MKVEKRSFEFEARVSGGGDTPVLTGYAVKWNENSQGLPFVERFLPGAFTRSLAEGNDVLALVGHDLGRVIGRRSNDTLTLTEDDTGLHVEIKPNIDTSHGRDIVAQIKRRDVVNLSVGFYAVEDRWNTEEGRDVREIVAAEIVEVSTASLPAYAGSTINARGDRKMENQETTVTTTETEVTETTTEQEEREQTEQRERRPVPTVLSTPIREERSAFAAYLRGEHYDTRHMTVSTATAGGYLAPDEFVAELIKALNEASVMRQIADVRGPVSAAKVHFPRLGSSVTAKWTPEATAITPGDPTFDQIAFTPHKLAALTTVSNELLADSALNVESMLADLFGEEFAATEDAAFFGGNGENKPTGILTNTQISTVETAAAGAINADEVLALYDALPPQYRANAVFVLHPSTMSKLRQLKDEAGQYLLVAGLAGAAPTTLLGRPVYLSSYMPEIATGAKSILFGDIKRAYRIVDRVGVDIQRSADRYFEQDLVAFRAIKRTDAKVTLPAAAVFLEQA